jgi:hypothetical protein
VALNAGSSGWNRVQYLRTSILPCGSDGRSAKLSVMKAITIVALTAVIVATPAIYGDSIDLSQVPLTNGIGVWQAQIPGVTCLTGAYVLSNLNILDGPNLSGMTSPYMSGWNGVELYFTEPIVSFSGDFSSTGGFEIIATNNAGLDLGGPISPGNNQPGDPSTIFLQVQPGSSFSYIGFFTVRGGSFAADNLSYTTAAEVAAPEPGTITMLCGLIAILPMLVRKAHHAALAETRQP